MATKTTTFRPGDMVQFRDENGQAQRGRVHSFGGANDGTGRHGVNVQTEDGRAIYWRETRQVRRA